MSVIDHWWPRMNPAPQKLPSEVEFSGKNPAPEYFAYHATTRDALPKIKRDGLEPKPPTAVENESGLYFAPSVDHAKVYGSVVLRFPWPDDAEEDWYGDTVFVDGDWVRSSYYTMDSISPDVIDVQTKNGWKPLLRASVSR